ncbi:g910 [Coccomyxa elongata]
MFSLFGGAHKSRHAAIQKRKVWNGEIEKTDSGLRKSDLTLSSDGKRVVSKARHILGKKRQAQMVKDGTWAKPFAKGHKARKSRKSHM